MFEMVRKLFRRKASPPPAPFVARVAGTRILVRGARVSTQATVRFTRPRGGLDMEEQCVLFSAFTFVPAWAPPSFVVGALDIWGNPRAGVPPDATPLRRGRADHRFAITDLVGPQDEVFAFLVRHGDARNQHDLVLCAPEGHTGPTLVLPHALLCEASTTVAAGDKMIAPYVRGAFFGPPVEGAEDAPEAVTNL